MTANQQKRQQNWLNFILFYCLVLLLILISLMVWENKMFTHALMTEDITRLPEASETYLINLNTATAEQLQELPRIGPVLAGEIIAYRETNGSFSSIEELLKVKGIGPATFEDLSALITV